MVPINSATQGLVQAGKNLEKAADRIARSSLSSSSCDTVSLSDNAVSLIEARNAYEVNLKSLSVVDDMNQKLLDVLA
jgi:flagellar basal body rod protein FlgG